MKGRFDFPGSGLHTKSNLCVGTRGSSASGVRTSVTRDPRETSIFCKGVKIVVLNLEFCAPVFTVSCSATPYLKPWTPILTHTK